MTRTTEKLEGVHFIRDPHAFTRSGAKKRRKPTLSELESRWAAVERAYDASCEIRKRAGLPAVEPTFWAHAIYAELEARRPADELAKRRKPRKRAKAPVQSKRADAPDVFRLLKPELIALGTPEALAELDRRQAKRAAKRQARIAA